MSTQVNVSLKEIYSKLCAECQKKVVSLVAEKAAEKAVKDALEEDKK